MIDSTAAPSPPPAVSPTARSSAAQERVPIWELKEITKTFPGVIANDSVSIRLYPGEIHGLMGENGCGKSTLIKTLSGAHQPDGGRILRHGRAVTLDNPIVARSHGVATVFQEFSVVPTLTVAENIFLGRLPMHRGQVDWRAMRDGAVATLNRMEIDIAPDAVVGDLSVAEQQLVEIAKAIAADASMIVLDEPTTALGIQEIDHLHALLRRLKAQGRAILYISHRLDEVVEIVDVITILKDGKVVSTAEESEIDIRYIVSAMVGEVGEHYPKQRNAGTEPLLEVRDIATDNKVAGASFDVRRGEVFGLGGVLGSGRTEIVRALFGVDALTRGELRVAGKPVRFDSPTDAIAAGLALVPENRKFDGLFFNFTAAPNITIANLAGLSPRGVLSLRREDEASRRLVDRLDIAGGAQEKTVDYLSGGNQQKVIIGRWLFTGADIFLLDEPTQGIDIGAKIAVYRLINELTAAGKAVVLVSSDHDELLAMSDRIGVVRHGAIVDVVEAAKLDKTDLVRSSSGEPA